MNSAASDPSEPPRMASKVTERIELVKLCSSKEWSKAIRILDSLLAQTCVIQDICNRAFCYSQLELHKHVIKDCDKALQLDPKLLQAYILKGHALSALGKKEEALLIWEQGYEHAVHQSADLKQLLELEELLKIAKQNTAVSSDNHLVESSGPESNTGPLVSTKSVETCDVGKASDGKLKACSNGMLESSEKSDNSSGLQNSSSAKKHKNIEHEPNELLERQANGTNNNCKKLGYPSLVCSELSDISEDSRKSSAITSESSEQSEPNELQEILSQLNNKCDVHLELSDEGKRNKKFCVTRVNKTKSINVDFRLSRGIAQVNEGRYSNAVSIFDQILEQDPTYPEALIGRGTALAFQRELDAAISDFTKAIQSNPSAGEAWKRRGQARAALGESAEAITDLTKALEFEPDSSDILHERGIVNFKFKDFKGAVEDLSTCVKFDKDNKSAYTYLGLALSSLGEYRKAEAAHKKAIQIERNFVEAWAHLAQDLNGKQTFNCLTSDEERSSLLSVLCDSVHLLGCNALIFYQDLANSEKALECLHQLLQIDGRYAKAYHLRGLLLHGMGEHRNAIKDLSMGLAIDSANIECLYLRASCYHAIGLFKEAVKDYDAALDLELDSMEKFVLQCLAFYQKEIALYTASKINSEFSWFDIDGDIDPLFKEYWCKRLHPKNVCEKVYRQPPLKESLKKGKQRKQEFTFTKQKTALLQAADSIGRNIQYHCPGFLHNRRQAMSMIGSISSLGETLIRSSWASASNSHRMAGLAAIEIAQKVSKAWRALQAEWRNSTKGTTKSGKRLRRREKLNSISVNRGGAGCSTSSSSETSTSYSLIDDRSTGRSMMSWNHLYSLAVKWRQISEPCDPVVWINKLSEEFNTGFGSHTPLVIGQAKVVRYYPNFQRTLTVAKAVIKEKKSVCNKEDKIIDLSEQQKLQEIMAAESCSDLYRVVGQDFWLATWCTSTAFEGKRLEGTRITVLKMGEIGFDFAIRTPCTPARWDDFDVEMTSAWEAVCYAYCGENYGSTDIDVLENVRDAILRMTYYWYNFMPLSRGTAVVGFIVLLGLLLAANMEFTGSIPKGLQVDWEAILEFDSSSFVDSVKRWLYPSLKVSTSWKNYPDVTSTFETTGSVVAALSNYSD